MQKKTAKMEMAEEEKKGSEVVAVTAPQEPSTNIAKKPAEKSPPSKSGLVLFMLKHYKI